MLAFVGWFLTHSYKRTIYLNFDKDCPKDKLFLSLLDGILIGSAINTILAVALGNMNHLHHGRNCVNYSLEQYFIPSINIVKFVAIRADQNGSKRDLLCDMCSMSSLRTSPL